MMPDAERFAHLTFNASLIRLLAAFIADFNCRVVYMPFDAHSPVDADADERCDDDADADERRHCTVPYVDARAKMRRLCGAEPPCDDAELRAAPTCLFVTTTTTTIFTARVDP